VREEAEGCELSLLCSFKNASALESFDLLQFLSTVAVLLEDKRLFDWFCLNMFKYQIIGNLQVQLLLLKPKDKQI